MSSPQKAKGSSYEREVAKFLSDLYGEPFVRVPNSGAFIGGSNQHRKQKLSENQIKGFKGDIIPPDSWTKFNAEAKSYADFPFHLVLTSECKQLNTWLNQLMAVAEDGDLNILFMKFNRKGRYIAVQYKSTYHLQTYIKYSSKLLGTWIVAEMDDFFKFNKDLLRQYSHYQTDTKSIQINALDIFPLTIN